MVSGLMQAVYSRVGKPAGWIQSCGGVSCTSSCGAICPSFSCQHRLERQSTSCPRACQWFPVQVFPASSHSSLSFLKSLGERNIIQGPSARRHLCCVHFIKLPRMLCGPSARKRSSLQVVSSVSVTCSIFNFWQKAIPAC